MTRASSTLPVPRERAPRRASNLTCLMSPRSVRARSLPIVTGIPLHLPPIHPRSWSRPAGFLAASHRGGEAGHYHGIAAVWHNGAHFPPRAPSGLVQKGEEVYGEVPGSRPASGLWWSMLVVAVDGQLGLQSVDWKDCTRPSSLLLSLHLQGVWPTRNNNLAQ